VDETNERCATDPQGQAENIDKRKTFLAKQIPDGDFDVIINHVGSFRQVLPG